MTNPIRLLAVCAILLSGLTGCSHKPSPIQQGVISELRWNAPGGDYTLRRVDRAIVGKQYRGNVNMYGVLYPTCLEVRFFGDSGAHVQIIPLNQIACWHQKLAL